LARLGVDATSVVPEGKGISRVQRRTVEALRELGRHELVVFARHPEELRGSVPVSPRLALTWELRGLRRAVKEHGLDVMLTWTERLPLVGTGRYLVWLFESPTHRIRQNRLAGAGLYQRGSDLLTSALWKRSLRRAAGVFAGSDATRDELPVEARTLYPGLDPEFTVGPAAQRPVREADQGEGSGGTGRFPQLGAGEGRYVFHIASSDPRDDHETALAAFALARSEVEGIRLLVAGGLRGSGGEAVDYLGRVPDEELVRLYRGAAAYLDTSLYEGFGFQVLEAMGCGTPVVATSSTSIPELVGNAALLCPPGSPGALADMLARVLEDDALAARLRQRGLARAREFTWAATARTIADAVDEVVA
jgi:glycosyltransferase involved in cell wall biosynthesis